MKLAGSIALVTGANRGLGLAFTRALLEMGAAKVYAAARDPNSIRLAGVEPIKLDVKSEEDAYTAARTATDVNLVINNAGINTPGSLLSSGAIDAAREHFDVNVLGTLRVARAFAPVLAVNGGGALINVLSVLSWHNASIMATYCVSKAAAWSVTNGLRTELEAQGTQVLGLHSGAIDTEMTPGAEVPKSAPEDIAKATLAALERGELQLLADEFSHQVHRGLSAPHSSYLGIAPMGV